MYFTDGRWQKMWVHGRLQTGTSGGREGNVYTIRSVSYGKAYSDQCIFVAMRQMVACLLTLFCVSLWCNTSLFAHEDTTSLYKAIKECDSLLFDVGFNKCDISRFENLLSVDFEFYHDRAGATETKQAFISGIREGLCKLPYKATWKLVPGSMTVYPLAKDGVIYGAVQTGTHEFYAAEPGRPVRQSSVAKFTHLWLLQEGKWKLARGLSYDHVEGR